MSRFTVRYHCNGYFSLLDDFCRKDFHCLCAKIDFLSNSLVHRSPLHTLCPDIVSYSMPSVMCIWCPGNFARCLDTQFQRKIAMPVHERKRYSNNLVAMDANLNRQKKNRKKNVISMRMQLCIFTFTRSDRNQRLRLNRVCPKHRYSYG